MLLFFSSIQLGSSGWPDSQIDMRQINNKRNNLTTYTWKWRDAKTIKPKGKGGSGDLSALLS